ncbi:hypothetical protein BCONGLO52_06370 [Brachybacterium conglomeratum]|uniref:Uncharacterized protein n=1 Tax=Brachybacterium conglomeratum TaxID=47846 RepID=A0ABQ5RD18_9MICO|nr:hypothetical protein BCONGLO52_06370 [Brachybacterium conglomeratum]GLK05335.1 hypothetical protein GCM10017597_21350 [Brachybacterium conglomeratum]
MCGGSRPAEALGASGEDCGRVPVGASVRPVRAARTSLVAVVRAPRARVRRAASALCPVGPSAILRSRCGGTIPCTGPGTGTRAADRGRRRPAPCRGGGGRGSCGAGLMPPSSPRSLTKGSAPEVRDLGGAVRERCPGGA